MNVLTPLVYCEMKYVDPQNGEVDICGFFAGERIEGLAVCEKDSARLRAAMDDEGVTLVKDEKIPFVQLPLSKKREKAS